MDKEQLSQAIATVERQISEAKSEIAKKTLKAKLERLKEELKSGASSGAGTLATLSKARKSVKALASKDFQKLVEKLSKKPEYSFLAQYSQDRLKRDLSRTAKPKGYRFVGDNDKKPTLAQIKKGLKDGTVYYEARPIRSDVSRVVQLGEGGNLEPEITIGKETTLMHEGQEKTGFPVYVKNSDGSQIVAGVYKYKRGAQRKRNELLKGKKMATGGKVGKYRVLNEILASKDKGIRYVSLNGFNESINYVIDLKLDDSEIKKVGENSYITLYAKGGGVGDINIKSLEGYWQSYNKGVMSGKKDEGYVSIKNEADLKNYITEKIGNVVKEIKLLEKGKSYPYNRSNPYYEDTYLVTLKNGITFEVERSYGRPSWSGNVDYKEQISINNIKNKMATGGGVEFWKPINEETISEVTMRLPDIDFNETLLSGKIWITFSKTPKGVTKLPYEVEKAIKEDFEYFSYGQRGNFVQVSLMEGSWFSMYIDIKNLTFAELEELLLELPEKVNERLEEKRIKGYGELGFYTYGEYFDVKLSNQDSKKMATGGGVEKGYNNPEKATHVLHIDGGNWYLEKIDSTHFYMSNDPKFRGMAHHVDQHRGEPYYEEVRTWLKSTKMATGGGIKSDLSALWNKTVDIAKKGYDKTKEISKKKIHDGKKAIAIDVIDETKGKVGKTDKSQLIKAKSIITKKFADGGTIKFRKLSKSNNFDMLVPEGRFEVELDSNNKVKSVVHPSGERQKASECSIYQKYKKEINSYLTERFVEGGGVGKKDEMYQESKWLTKEQWENWREYVKTGKIDGKKENNIFTVARWVGAPVSKINAYEIEQRAKKHKKYADGGNIENSIDKLYEKAGFINADMSWQFKLLEMLQDGSSEAHDIYQGLNEEQKEEVLQELYEMDNDMGSYGDSDMETSRENLEIILHDAESGHKYGKGGGIETIQKGDKVIWEGNEYTVFKITENKIGGFVDKKYHLHSYKVGVDDAILDSLKGVSKPKFAKGGGVNMSYAYGSHEYKNSFGIEQKDFIQMVDAYYDSYSENQYDRIESRMTFSEMRNKYGESKVDEIGEYLSENYKLKNKMAKGGGIKVGKYIVTAYDGKSKEFALNKKGLKAKNDTDVAYFNSDEADKFIEKHKSKYLNVNKFFIRERTFNDDVADYDDFVDRETNLKQKKYAGGGVGDGIEDRYARLTEKEAKRLDELQKKEDNNDLTKSENEEYEKLVYKYRGWGHKKAEGGNIDSSYLGTTRIGKGHYGWTAKTTTKKQINGYDWEITTMKRSSGDLVSTANGGKREEKDTYATFTFSPFEDPSFRLVSSKPKMVNEKAVTKQHEEALKIFIEKLNEMKSDKMATGGRVKAGKVNEKYYINKQGVGKKSKYNVEVHLDGNTETVSTFIQNGQLRTDSYALPKYVINQLISLYKQDGHEIAYDSKGNVMGAYADGGMMATGGGVKQKDENYNYIVAQIERNEKALEKTYGTERVEQLQQEIQRLKDKLKNEYGVNKMAKGGSVGYDEDIKATKEVIKAFFDKYGDALGLTETEAINKIEAQEYLGRGASSFNFLSVSSNIDDKLKKDQTKPNRGYLIFGSDINPNGVTGKDDIARTYTIDLEIKGRKRISLRSYDNDGRYFKVYAYGRTVDELLDKISTPMLQLLKGMVEKDGLKFSSVKAEGGNIPKVKVGEIITTNTGVKVKVVAYDPLFGGRIKAVRMDEYGDGKESQWIPIKKFKYKDGGNVGKYIYIPNDDISKIVLKSKQVIGKNRILDGAYVKGGEKSNKFVEKYKFPIGSVVWDKTHKTYGVVLNNYGDETYGSHDEIRLDSDGNQNIHTYDKKWNNNGYNLVPYGSEEDRGNGDLTDAKESATRLIEMNSKRKQDAEQKKYYEDVYEDLLSGKIDGKPYKATSGSKPNKNTSNHGKFGDDNPRLVNFDIDDLDQYEEMVYNDMKKNNTKASTLQVIINTVEGDYTQLSPKLAEIAEEQFTSDEWDEESNKRYFATGGNIDKDRLFNFLKDDLEKLKEAIKENDQEEIDKFFSYWNQHLKGLRSESNERMYNFLKDDLEELQEDIEENDQEDIDKFFSYWGQHLESVKFATGGSVSSYFDDMTESEILKATVVYDNGGETIDRYTVFTPDGSVFGMSENPTRAFNGFNQYIGDESEIEQGSHLGKRLKSVPKDIQKAVLDRMKEEFADGGSMYAGGGSTDSKKVYVYSGYNATASEDSYEDGELENVGDWDVNEAKTFNSKQELVDYINENIIYSDYEISDFDWESGEGRNVQTDVLCSYDDYNGYFPASDSEKELWKKGKKKLYNVHYWINVMPVIPTEFKRGGNTSYSYIEKDKIDRIVTNSGKEYGSKVILDGAYVTDRVRTPKMSRTQFEDETYSFAHGGTIIQKGNRVRIVNTQFDGKEGLIISNDLHNGNYLVQMEDESIKGFPFENLMLLSREQYATGGEITPEEREQGLKNYPKLNF
jgi:hypothetical protein